MDERESAEVKQQQGFEERRGREVSRMVADSEKAARILGGSGSATRDKTFDKTSGSGGEAVGKPSVKSGLCPDVGDSASAITDIVQRASQLGGHFVVAIISPIAAANRRPTPRAAAPSATALDAIAIANLIRDAEANLTPSATSRANGKPVVKARPSAKRAV